MPVIFAERTVFYRERAASMYAPRAIALAQGVAELPYLVVQAVVMVCIAYWMVGFDNVAWKFFYFLLLFFEVVTMVRAPHRRCTAWGFLLTRFSALFSFA